MRSVLAIGCPHWRAQVLVWLVGAHGILSGSMRLPSELGKLKRPQMTWSWSHCLSGDHTAVSAGTSDYFFPAQNRRQVLETVASVMTEDVLLDWLFSMDEFEYLKDELMELPDRFCELYLWPGAAG